MPNVMIPRSLIRRAFELERDEHAGLAADCFEDFLYEDYSGRGMFGARCFGFKCEALVEAHWILIALAQVETEEDSGPVELAYDLTIHMAVDSLGYQTIAYFPGYSLEEDEVDCILCENPVFTEDAITVDSPDDEGVTHQVHEWCATTCGWKTA